MAVTPDRVKKLLNSFIVADDPITYDNSISLDSSSNGITSGEVTTLRGFTRHNDRDAYFDRVHTDQTTTWCAKPAELSPLVCARYGWANTGVDMLRCVDCRAVVCSVLPTNTSSAQYSDCVDQLKLSLLSAHDVGCSWKSNPTSVTFCTIVTDNRPELLQSIRSRFTSIQDCGLALPKLCLTTIQTSGIDEQALRRALSDVAGEMEVDWGSLVLALFGWQKGDTTAVIACELCGRSVGLWNYQPSSSCDTPSSDTPSDTSHDNCGMIRSNHATPSIMDTPDMHFEKVEYPVNSAMDISDNASPVPDTSNDTLRDDTNTRICDTIIDAGDTVGDDTAEVKDDCKSVEVAGNVGIEMTSGLDGTVSDGDGQVNDGKVCDGDGQVNDGKVSDGDGQVNDGKVSDGDGQVNDGKVSDGDGQVNDGKVSDGVGQVNDGKISDGDGQVNDGKVSDGDGQVNDGKISDGDGQVNDGKVCDGDGQVNDGKVSDGDGQVNDGKVSDGDGQVNDGKVSDGDGQVNDGKVCDGDGQVNDGKVSDGDGQVNDGKVSDGDGQVNDGKVSDGDGQVNDGKVSDGDGQVNDGKVSDGDGQVNDGKVSGGDGQVNDGKVSDGDGQMNDGKVSDGYGQVNDGKVSDGDGQVNDGKVSDGDGQVNDGKVSDGDGQVNDGKVSDGDGQVNDGTVSDGDGQVNDGAKVKKGADKSCNDEGNGAGQSLVGDGVDKMGDGVVDARNNSEGSAGEEEKGEKREREENLPESSPGAKRIKKFLGLVDFDPISEHKYWCPWLTPVRSRRSQSHELSHTPPAYGQRCNSVGWQRVLQALGLLDSATHMSLQLRQSPQLEGLRSLRYMLRDWSARKVLHH